MSDETPSTPTPNAPPATPPVAPPATATTSPVLSVLKFVGLAVLAIGAIAGLGVGGVEVYRHFHSAPAPRPMPYAIESAPCGTCDPPARPRGRVAPANLQHLKELYRQRAGSSLRLLPRATAADFDSRSQGWVGPVKDQGQCGSCFTGDTMIRMSDGTYKRIDQIAVGDLVVSAEGNVRKVSHVLKRQVDEHLSRIAISGHCELQATKEHPILTQDGYVKISEMKVGQFVAIPRFLPGESESCAVDGRLRRPLVNDSPFSPFAESVANELPNRTALTHGFGRLVGLFIAEGTSSSFDRKVVWSLSAEEADTFGAEIVDLCRSELGVAAKSELISDRGVCKITVNSASLSRQFLEWFGSGPENKTVPGCFMSANREFLAGMLSGWVDGDRQRGESAVTVSPVLAMQMHDVANYLGFMPSLLVHTQPKTDGRGVFHLRSWRVGLNNPATYKRGAAKLTDTHMWRKVTAVGEGDYHSGTVYNLEVEGDHSYVANGIGVHNCWDFSGTGIVEIAYNKAGVGGGPSKFVLSEQYTLSCGRNGGCNGDDNTTVLEWAKSTGLPLTADYGPYAARGFFSRCSYSSSMPLYKIPDWGFADGGQGDGVTSVADIKAAIQAYGAVGVGVAADGAFESWGNSGASFDRPFKGSGSRNIDHDVILVGWHDDAELTGGGYWILRNSWGESWGVGGYMAICYGANDVGTEAVFAMAPSGPNPPPPGPTPGPNPPPPPAPPVPPAPLAIAGSTTIPCYGIAELSLTGTYTTAGWMVFPDRATGAQVVTSYTAPNGAAFLFSGPPGVYDVGAYAQTANGVQTLQATVTIQPPSTPQPTPPPAPAPAPAPTPPPAPTPQVPAADPAFVPIGKAHKASFGPAYADAWEAGAKALESGKTLTDALTIVAKDWDQYRANLFVQHLSPVFAKIIPDATPDASITSAQRSAMAAAWRGLAAGLRQP